MTATTLYFTGPGNLALRDRSIPEPDPETVLVKTKRSAISPGTERLVRQGEAPDTVGSDGHGTVFEEDLSFPLKYGYAAVGEVVETGAAVSGEWLGQRVFAYNPHESHFLADPSDLVVVPEHIPDRIAPLLANTETAVNLLLDGQPIIGERVAVFGQGVVGLLTTGLLARTPIEVLAAVEPIEARRQLAREFGATVALDPTESDIESAVGDVFTDHADLTFELSGNPAALDRAIGVTGFDGRVIVGSWYGTRRAALDLGSWFHRNRIDLVSSQVSTIAPNLDGRWSRERRHDVAWEWVEKLPVESLITHELPFDRAADAYQLLDERPDEAVQVVFRYD